MMKEKRGVALIWSLVLGTILIIISTTMADVIIKESRMSSDINLSSNAITAAQAGVAWGRACLDDSTCPATWPQTLNIDNDSRVEVSISDPDANGERIITSTGISANSVRRRIEFKWNRNVPEVIAGHPGDDGSNILTKYFSIPGNFNLLFYFGGTNRTGTKIGLSNTRGTSFNLYLEFTDETTMVLKATDVNGTTVVSDPIDTTGFNIDNPQTSQISIEYIRGLAAKLTIKSKNDENYSCEKSVDLDIAALTMPPLRVFQATSPNAPQTLTLDTSNEYLHGDDRFYYVGNTYIDGIAGTGIDVITANFYNLTLTAPASGTINMTRGSNPFFEGDEAEITAVPNAGYAFSGWTGDCSGSNNPLTITMNANKTCSASFYQQFTGDHASYVSQSTLTTYRGGLSYSTTITFRNDGTTTWPLGGFVLANRTATDWGVDNISLPRATVAPGESATFVINFTAPATAGYYPFQWGVKKGATFLTESSLSRNLTINTGSWNLGVPGSVLEGKTVYRTDSGINKWQVTNVTCTSPQCVSSRLVGDNTVNFASYPARDACKTLGGRLPTTDELSSIYQHRVYFGNNFSANWYWSNLEASSATATVRSFSTGASSNGTKSNLYSIRCVKD